MKKIAIQIFSFFLMLFCSSGFSQSSLPALGNPASLTDNDKWFAENSRFREAGSETRAYLDLVTILYDWDNQRPWGAEYFPEANRRLAAFRQALCPSLTGFRGCTDPAQLNSPAEISSLQSILQEPASLELFSARWNIKISNWSLPTGGPKFALLAALNSQQRSAPIAYWNFPSRQISETVYQYELLPEPANYRAGFDSQDAAAYFSTADGRVAINDWQLSQRAMDFAGVWKHAIAANRKIKPSDPVIDATELQFQKMFEDASADFSRVYSELYQKIAAIPELRKRFEAERSQGDYPEEVYQSVAHQQFLDLAHVQASYFALLAPPGAATLQQGLEALVTAQRYSAFPRLFALELSTLIDPLNSHGFVLDEIAGQSVAMTYVLENLKALLGMDRYQGQGTFPTAGRGLLAPGIFNSAVLQDEAPDVARELKGRDFTELELGEQTRLLKLYLQPASGKARAMAVFRLGVAFLGSASAEELQRLAEQIHRAHFEESI